MFELQFVKKKDTYKNVTAVQNYYYIINQNVYTYLHLKNNMTQPVCVNRIMVLNLKHNFP